MCFRDYDEFVGLADVDWEGLFRWTALDRSAGLQPAARDFITLDRHQWAPIRIRKLVFCEFCAKIVFWSGLACSLCRVFLHNKCYAHRVAIRFCPGEPYRWHRAYSRSRVKWRRESDRRLEEYEVQFTKAVAVAEAAVSSAVAEALEREASERQRDEEAAEGRYEPVLEDIVAAAAARYEVLEAGPDRFTDEQWNFFWAHNPNEDWAFTQNSRVTLAPLPLEIEELPFFLGQVLLFLPQVHTAFISGLPDELTLVPQQFLAIEPHSGPEASWLYGWANGLRGLVLSPFVTLICNPQFCVALLDRPPAERSLPLRLGHYYCIVRFDEESQMLDCVDEHGLRGLIHRRHVEVFKEILVPSSPNLKIFVGPDLTVLRLDEAEQQQQFNAALQDALLD